MADITMINHYANPAFNAQDEALSFFTKETRDQYRGFSRQLEQMKYDTESSLKESVFDHYTEFIGFSAEIQKMDDAMEQLKKNLTRTYKVLENLKDTSLTVEESDGRDIDIKALVIPDNLAWIKTVCDDIDLFVFQRRFTEAVDLSIRAQNELAAADISSNPLLMDLQTKLSAKSELLVTKLVAELFSVDSSRSDRRRICRLLCGLGREREAGVLYLKRASEEIATHHRLVKPCGDIPSLIEGLADLFFECLQDTVVNYQGLFGDKGSGASFGICLSWLTQEIGSFIHKILLMALGDQDEALMTPDAFVSFASCIAPLLHGASILGDVGCAVDECIVRLLGEKVGTVVETVFKTILTEVKALPPPEATTTTISFRSALGLEKREVSTHAAAVYAALAPFAQACPVLLDAALLPFVSAALRQGFEALAAHESAVYERWVRDRANPRLAVPLNDLYFWSTDLLPYLSFQFVTRMHFFGTALATCFDRFKAALRSQTVFLFQTVCSSFISVAKFDPTLYISTSPHTRVSFIPRATHRGGDSATDGHDNRGEAAAVRAEAVREDHDAVVVQHDEEGGVHGGLLGHGEGQALGRDEAGRLLRERVPRLRAGLRLHPGVRAGVAEYGLPGSDGEGASAERQRGHAVDEVAGEVHEGESEAVSKVE